MKYLEVFKLSFKMQIVWRFDVAMTVLAALARIFAAWLIWGAVYSGVQSVAGMSFEAMLSYYIASSLIASLNKSRSVAGEISEVIRAGRFSGHMVVPMNPMAYFGAMVAGEAAFPFVFSLAASAMCAAAMGIRVVTMAAAADIASGLCMALIGMVFMVVFQYILGILAFKLLSINAVIFVANHLTGFVTGAIVPLILLPGWAQHAMSFLPFYYVNYLPAMLITGQAAGQGLAGLYILAAWTAASIVLGNMLYNRLRVCYDGVGI